MVVFVNGRGAGDGEPTGVAESLDLDFLPLSQLLVRSAHDRYFIRPSTARAWPSLTLSIQDIFRLTRLLLVISMDRSLDEIIGERPVRNIALLSQRKV